MKKFFCDMDPEDVEEGLSEESDLNRDCKGE